MVDLKTTYLGMELKNPLVASASPLSEKVETVQKLEEAGIAAVVMYSLFEEQITRESMRLHKALEQGSDSFPEALSYFPERGRYGTGPDKYLEHIKALKSAVSIPVIASLNGVTTGKWIELAKQIEEAGADALELNIYDMVTDPEVTSQDMEDNYVNLVQNITAGISIPVAVKLSPFFTALPNLAKKLVESGAKGLVLFNRFYQPDYDLEELEVVPNLVLSTSHELRLPLRWIAVLSGSLDTSYALTTGVHNAHDVLKSMMAGANVAMMASELLAHGIERPAEILADLTNWMEEHEYESIVQMQGSMNQQSVADPDKFERANYMKVLSSFELLP